MKTAGAELPREGRFGLRRRDFERIRELVHSEAGLKLADTKLTMVEARLQKRIRALGLPSFEAYCDYLFSIEGAASETVQLIDHLTTNKTDFFRAPEQFRFLTDKALPELAQMTRRVRVWSAGCSTGEEPYTIAMVLSDYADSPAGAGFTYSILGTDISTRALERAVQGTYSAHLVEPVPMSTRRRYLLRHRDPKKALVRIGPELRRQVRFRRLNLLEPDLGLDERFEIIFCRNVIIYFDRPTQEAILERICRHLVPGGYLFVGSSESLIWMDLPLRTEVSTIHRKVGAY